MNISNKSNSFLLLAQELELSIYNEDTRQVAENVTEELTNKDLL
jgi:hypothetical protein